MIFRLNLTLLTFKIPDKRVRIAIARNRNKNRNYLRNKTQSKITIYLRRARICAGQRQAETLGIQTAPWKHPEIRQKTRQEQLSVG
jgi:hypothetical protein